MKAASKPLFLVRISTSSLSHSRQVGSARLSCMLLIWLVVVGSWCSVANAEGDRLQSARVRWTVTTTSLLESPEAGSRTTGTLSKGTMLAVLDEKRSPRAESFVFVTPIESSHAGGGWVSLAATSLSSQDFDQRDVEVEDVGEQLPILIQRLPEPQREDFRRLSNAIQVAEQSGAFIPDVYVARAELWTIAGDTHEAIEDFRKAAAHALSLGTSHSEQVLQLRNLCDALERLEKAPHAAEGIDASNHAAAAKHFGEGYTLYWGNSFRKAEQHLQNAIMLNPADPRYWYFRGLARRHRGDQEGARHDVLVAAFLERSKPRDPAVARALTRCQGVDRFWLEEFRRGDPTQQLLELELDNVVVSPGVVGP